MGWTTLGADELLLSQIGWPPNGTEGLTWTSGRIWSVDCGGAESAPEQKWAPGPTSHFVRSIFPMLYICGTWLVMPLWGIGWNCVFSRDGKLGLGVGLVRLKVWHLDFGFRCKGTWVTLCVDLGGSIRLCMVCCCGNWAIPHENGAWVTLSETPDSSVRYFRTVHFGVEFENELSIALTLWLKIMFLRLMEDVCRAIYWLLTKASAPLEWERQSDCREKLPWYSILCPTYFITIIRHYSITTLRQQK